MWCECDETECVRTEARVDKMRLIYFFLFHLYNGFFSLLIFTLLFLHCMNNNMYHNYFRILLDCYPLLGHDIDCTSHDS